MLDDNKGHLRGADDETRRTIAAIYTIGQEQPDEYLLDALENTVRVRTTMSAREKRNIAITTSKQARIIGAKTLAKNWCIGLKQAEMTIKATTQRGLRTTLHLTLSR